MLLKTTGFEYLCALSSIVEGSIKFPLTDVECWWTARNNAKTWLENESPMFIDAHKYKDANVWTMANLKSAW